MDSTRQNKISRLLQKELGEIFRRESKSLFAGAFITVTNVKVTPDLSLARVHLSFLAVKEPEALLKLIQTKSKEVRKMMGDIIRNQVRIIPEFHYYIDDSLDQAMRIEELLNQAKRKIE